AMILQGTREFLMGDPRAAISFFTKVLAKDKSNTEAMIKLGSCYMELGDSEEAINRFNMAEAANKHNPDIYYHRAQVRFLLEDLDKALTDYQRAIELNPDFLFSYIQMAVTLYKSKKHDEAEALFKKTLDQFPDRFETWNYYGEILMDQQRLDEAEAAFKRSLELDTEKRSPLALINQAILASQVRKDLAAAEALCQEALQRDAECEVAYNQLAQVYLQQQRFPEAIRCYDQVIDIVRNPVELLGMISCREAAAVQYYVMEKFPEDMRKLQASIGGA
ncbi:TPR-like protein, partial [Caulochytrium protostelioides]